MLFDAPEADRVRRQRVVAVLTAMFFALSWHLWVGDANLNAAEEGYLWYGSWRTGLGELPLRDFQSYDPGRYLACAALGKVLGTGLLGLRRSLAVFQGLGLLFGLLAARRAVRSSWPLVPLGIVLGFWLFPRHKVFEGVMALAATWAGTCLLERPTRRWHLVAGACAGLAAFFGRNHGLYAVLGFLVLFAVSAWRRRDADWRKTLASLAGGVVLGYSPMLVLFLFVPGFWHSFVGSLLLLLRLGTNLPAPWLWPWKVELAGATPYQAAVRVALAVIYLLPVTVLPYGIWRLFRARAEELEKRALLLAAAVLGALYVHHAAVRSDSAHLAQAIQPTLLATVALLAQVVGRRRRAGASLVCALGACALLSGFEHNPSLAHVGHGPLLATQLGDETLRMLPQQADYYTRLQRALAKRIAPEDQVFFAPSRPAFYPLFGKRSPSWWIYFFVPKADQAEQDGIIAELGGVKWVLIVDVPIADEEDLRFRNSYPLVWSYVHVAYERVPTPELEGNHLLFRLRQ